METPERGTQQGQGSKLVEVELNGNPKTIAAAEYTGATLKAALSVPPDDELDRVVGHEFKEIRNDEKVHVHGGEKFVSHRGQGQSS